jgi:plastocyanin
MSVKMLVPVAALAVAMVVAGCSTSEDATSQPAPTSSSDSPTDTSEKPASGAPSEDAGAAEPLVIEIKDFEFRGPEKVAPGATVQVQNNDRSTHSFTSASGDFAEVVLEGGGATGMFTAPSEPGEYRYVCKFHPEMVATLVVG